jgi:hypothetical protein
LEDTGTVYPPYATNHVLWKTACHDLTDREGKLSIRQASLCLFDVVGYLILDLAFLFLFTLPSSSWAHVASGPSSCTLLHSHAYSSPPATFLQIPFLVSSTSFTSHSRTSRPDNEVQSFTIVSFAAATTTLALHTLPMHTLLAHGHLLHPRLLSHCLELRLHLSSATRLLEPLEPRLAVLHRAMTFTRP